MAGRIYDIIDGLNVGRDWKLTFKKIHIKFFRNYAQGKNVHPIFWAYASELSELSLINKAKMSTWFNPLGFLFGPFYYIFKGLYLKGGILLLMLLVLLYGNSATRVMIIFISFYCAFFINVDYFKKMVLNHPDVTSNPMIVGNDFDEMVFANLLTQKTSPLPYILIGLILLYPVYLEGSKLQYDRTSLKYLVSEPEAICKGKEDCLKVVKEYFNKINATKNPEEVSNYYYDIARAYYSLDDTINTIKSLDSAITFDSHNINAYLLRAKLYAKTKNNVQSLLDYKEALKINPQATFLNYYIGFNYYALGKYDRALEYFEKATKTNDEPSYFEAQAYTRKMLNDKQGAIKDIKKAISLYKKENKNDKVQKLEKYLQTLEK